MRAVVFHAWSLALAMILGCGDDKIAPAENPSAAELTSSGWDRFEAGDYSSARSLYYGALAEDLDYAEAHTGLGWCWLNLHSLESSLASFNLALSGESRAADAFAGKVLVLQEMGGPFPYDSTAAPHDAAASAESVLARNYRYVFVHDPAVDWKDLRVALAESRYHESTFPSAFAQVESLGGVALDPTSPLFAVNLEKEIERLADETSTDSARLSLSANWRIWKAQALHDYDYDLQMISFTCGVEKAEVQVRGGIVHEILYAQSGAPMPDQFDSCFRLTLDDLFSEAHLYLYFAERGHVSYPVRVHCDSFLGYPRQMEIRAGEYYGFVAELIP